jgi:hypothetical protein
MGDQRAGSVVKIEPELVGGRHLDGKFLLQNNLQATAVRAGGGDTVAQLSVSGNQQDISPGSSHVVIRPARNAVYRAYTQ